MIEYLKISLPNLRHKIPRPGTLGIKRKNRQCRCQCCRCPNHSPYSSNLLVTNQNVMFMTRLRSRLRNQWFQFGLGEHLRLIDMTVQEMATAVRASKNDPRYNRLFAMTYRYPVAPKMTGWANHISSTYYMDSPGGFKFNYMQDWEDIDRGKMIRTLNTTATRDLQLTDNRGKVVKNVSRGSNFHLLSEPLDVQVPGSGQRSSSVDSPKFG